MHLAAAAGGAASRAGLNYLANRAYNYAFAPVPRTQAPFPTMVPLQQALPVYAPQRRGRSGRGRGRGRGAARGRRAQARSIGQPNSGIGTRAAGKIVVVDTEVLGSPLKTFTYYQFSPSNAALPRLDAHAKMYERYKINYFNISYKSGSSTNVPGNIAIGVSPGPRIAAVTSQDTILKLKPSFYIPAWRNEALSVGGLIDSQRFMHVGKDGEDGISFTLYVQASADNLGKLQVSYSVQFAYPVPF